MMDNNQEPSTGGSKRPSMKKKMSSVFLRARRSFTISKGKRGASVETLRGNTGADFEGKAVVQRGPMTGIGCSCFGGNPEKEMFLLVKGHFLFVFSSEDAAAPKYAIDLAHKKTSVDAPRDGSTIARLETALGDVEYEFLFDTKQDPEIVQRFVAVVAEQAAVAEAELAKKRLGHEHLLKTRASVRYAESVGAKKTEDQPDAPLTAAEVADAAPVPLGAY